MTTALDHFFHPSYQLHNAARLQHLASLGLPLEKKRVLELGAGPGDHTGFYVDRGCRVVSLDARQECVDYLRARWPSVDAYVADLNTAELDLYGAFEIIHCYGLLYHLNRPDLALERMAAACDGFMVLETCVSQHSAEGVDHQAEDAGAVTQAADGRGCRPSRAWLFAELGKHWPHVYQTRTQPRHDEFPIDWTVASPHDLSRVVMVASKEPIDNWRLSSELLQRQVRW